MKFENHIAYRFINDERLLFDFIEEMCADEWQKSLATGEPTDKIQSMYSILCAKDTKNYFITDTVLDKLDMLKVSRKGEHYNWTVFDKTLKDQRVCFIMPDNKLMKMVVQDEMIYFCHAEFTFNPGDKVNGVTNWVLFYLNRKTGELCEHFEHKDVKAIEQFYYTLLCFMYLTDNEEILIPPGRSYGTRKQGKVLNDIRVPITLVNSRWNITSIRTEGFNVSGHFRLQPCGPDRGDVKIIFIEPFAKEGYVRKSGKELENA
jgi:hypothetical protein